MAVCLVYCCMNPITDVSNSIVGSFDLGNFCNMYGKLNEHVRDKVQKIVNTILLKELKKYSKLQVAKFSMNAERELQFNLEREIVCKMFDKPNNFQKLKHENYKSLIDPIPNLKNTYTLEQFEERLFTVLNTYNCSQVVKNVMDCLKDKTLM